MTIAQRIHQPIYGLQQGTRVSIHPIYGIAMHWRQRCFLVTLEELADSDDHVQGRSQVVTN